MEFWTVAVVLYNRAIVRAMLDPPQKGEVEIARHFIEKLKTVGGCDTYRVVHGHAPFADLITDLPGLKTAESLHFY